MDPHLNLFRRYNLGLDQEYENNVTHALINTLRLSDPRVTRTVLTQLVPEIERLAVDWSDVGWALQRPPLDSPEAFQNRVMLGISPTPILIPVSAPAGSSFDQVLDGSEEEPQGEGIPDAWIYTKNTKAFCASIEVKTRGNISVKQISRHIQTHFGAAGTTISKLDLSWATLSQSLDRAVRDYPNQILSEFLTFLAAEGLAATLRFDGATIQRANDSVPLDCRIMIRDELTRQLNLNDEDVIILEWPPVLIFRNFDAVGNIELYLEGEPPQVDIRTLLSLGTTKAGAGFNRLSMPNQIQRLLVTLADPKTKSQFVNEARAAGRHLQWTVLDRLQRVQFANWDARESHEIIDILRAAGREVSKGSEEDFGIDHKFSATDLERLKSGLEILHRAGTISDGNYKNYSIFARAYLDELRVPVYERLPGDVVPQVVEHCLLWHRILRILSGYS